MVILGQLAMDVLPESLTDAVFINTRMLYFRVIMSSFDVIFYVKHFSLYLHNESLPSLHYGETHILDESILVIKAISLGWVGSCKNV